MDHLSNRTFTNQHITMPRFKDTVSLLERKAECARIRAKYPERIPVIVERQEDGPKETSTSVPSMDRKKFLVPADLTIGQFVYIIRKRIRIAPEQAIFVFVHNTLPTVSSTVAQVYDERRDEDGFLYLVYSGERTFGFCDESKI